MKLSHAMVLAACAALALMAAFGFRYFKSDSGEIIGASATSSQVSVSTVSADALTLPVATSSTPNGTLKVKAAAVMDLTSGNILHGIHPDLRWPIASITKLMTAAVALDRFSATATVTMVPDDFMAAGSALSAELQPGDQYSLQDILKVLLVPSSNEAAEAIARSFGRSAFMAAMNSQAAAWDLPNTHFDDPSGLSVANQSTPREYLELVRRVYALHPDIFAVTQARSATVRDLSTGELRHFPTTNNFAGRADFIGGKTGTTPEAGDNLISVFNIADRPLAVLVFGAADRYAATESLLQLIR